MTRKDYESIALVLLSERSRSMGDEFDNDVAAKVLDNVAYALAVEFKADNPRFDRDRFLIASGATRTSR
jgi:hypothetical protein